MSLSPAAIGIIFNENKTQVLLVKRADIPVWVLPGGGIDSNETPEQAVIREIKEETGLDVKIERKSAEYTPINILGAFTSVFVCKIIGGSICLSAESVQVEFFEIRKYPPLFFEVHQKWIEDAVNSSTLIKAPIHGVNYFMFVKYFFKHPTIMFKYTFTRLRKILKKKEV